MVGYEAAALLTAASTVPGSTGVSKIAFTTSPGSMPLASVPTHLHHSLTAGQSPPATVDGLS